MESEKRVDVVIHTYPARMWYVEGFLIPELERQGADSIRVWNDTEKRGNLQACMDCFAAMDGEGETWHIQDDVLLCRDFVERARKIRSGTVYGFCNVDFTDDPGQVGIVYAADAWHSFQCVKIPDAYARECADWYRSGAWKKLGDAELPILNGLNKGDDSFFNRFMQDRHGREEVYNAKPNLAEHVDWIIGGSVLHPWRGYLARAYYWEDEDLVSELKEAVKGKVQYIR